MAKAKEYTIKVTANPNFCGIGAGSVQFANGEGTTDDPVIAAWYANHEGYSVTGLETAKKGARKPAKAEEAQPEAEAYNAPENAAE